MAQKKKKFRITRNRNPSILTLYKAGIKTKIVRIHTDAEGVDIEFDGEPTADEKQVLEQFYNHGIVTITEVE